VTEPVPGESRLAAVAVDAAGIPLFAAAILEPSEIIVGIWRPSAWYVPRRAARMTALLVAITVVGSSAAGAAGLPWGSAIVQVGAMLVVARVAAAILDWSSRWYVLTDRRVIRRRGVLSPTVFVSGLRDLRRVDLAADLGDRALGTGTVSFGTRPEGPYDAAWVMVPRAADVHALVVATKRRYGGN
jgi:uncharacterized membrane protein YdbT with pleckstrin-like domain